MQTHIKDEYGFSLAETLMAVLILLMVTSVVATGIPAAANAYFKAVDASHAQVLLSTTMISLSEYPIFTSPFSARDFRVISSLRFMLSCFSAKLINWDVIECFICQFFCFIFNQ